MSTAIATKHAPGAVGPYVQGRKTEHLVFTSGQLGLIPETGEYAGPDVESQARQALKNVQAILEAGGSSMDKVLKTIVYLTDMADFAKVNAIYAEFFKEGCLPARTCFACVGLPKGGLIEVEAIAEI